MVEVGGADEIDLTEVFPLAAEKPLLDPSPAMFPQPQVYALVDRLS